MFRHHCPGTLEHRANRKIEFAVAVEVGDRESRGTGAITRASRKCAIAFTEEHASVAHPKVQLAVPIHIRGSSVSYSGVDSPQTVALSGTGTWNG